MKRCASLCLIAATLTGCGETKPPPEPARPTIVLNIPASLPSSRESAVPTTEPTIAVDTTPKTRLRRPSDEPLDARRVPRTSYQVAVVKLTAPLGQISGDESLWKSLDEQVISAGTYDLLWKNGIRVGTGPQRDLAETLKPYLVNAPWVTVGREAQYLEVMRTRVPDRQDLFYFDRENVLIGRTFDACENVLRMSYVSAIRRPGAVSVSLTPTIESTRQRMAYSLTPGKSEREFKLFRPQTLYDLSLQVDLPLDHFLLIAPSPESKLERSIGRIFFTEDTPADRSERAIVVVIRAVATEGMP